ncbi:DHA2 family efflux MFS transporter permease subunit [Corynebacterium sp. 3HC-13]|uniref:DHA2 family efflux MFS transporter permease subunit n=1 Tax=Corynebacterium poyangense TaxID=2684405 RepID=UPI001CCA464F|nr:DHA2 family efflux MFS transporter permease subunit [Corynebacterium poyangense]MBZ8176452.1 DHA2 family efflux MFS transporter permease subunit [Corynebacterium poyangense]
MDSKRANLLIACLVTATTVMILNETLLSVALPAIMADFHLSADIAQWLSTGFMLTMAVVIPVTGYIQQVLPTRTIFITSVVLFLVGTFVAALAPGFMVVLVGRILQAAGTAIIIPLLMTVVLTIVEPSSRGSVMGIITVAIAVAPTVGPTLSGLILSFATWHWLFWIMLVLGILVFFAGLRLLVNVGEVRRIPLDILSVVLSALGFGGLVYALSSISAVVEHGNKIPVFVGIAGVVLLAVFVLRQLRLVTTYGPLLDVRVLKERNFTLGMCAILGGFGVIIGVSMVLPLYLQGSVHVSEILTGLVVLPGGLLQGFMSPFIGRLYDRYGPRPLAIPGALVLCLGVWAFVFVVPSGKLSLIILSHILVALGMGLVMTPMMTAALGALPKRLYSHGSAVLNTLQQLAGAAGTALLIAMMTLGQNSALESGVSLPEAMSHGTQVAFAVAGVIAILVLVAVLFVRRPADAPTPAE